MRRCVPWGRPAIAWLPSRTISSGATANVFGQNTICMTTAMLDQICSPADLRKLDRRELKNLARQLRGFVLESVSRTGGHLSSNLGTVELTIALHYVFNTPDDRVGWDVGHQSYPHKILTGRRGGTIGRGSWRERVWRYE